MGLHRAAPRPAAQADASARCVPPATPRWTATACWPVRPREGSDLSNVEPDLNSPGVPFKQTRDTKSGSRHEISGLTAFIAPDIAMTMRRLAAIAGRPIARAFGRGGASALPPL